MCAFKSSLPIMHQFASRGRSSESPGYNLNYSKEKYDTTYYSVIYFLLFIVVEQQIDRFMNRFMH
jgi:hypothetical protein